MARRNISAIPASNSTRTEHLRSIPATVEIGARHRLEPMQQGKLDSLCGLYSMINALRLALAENAPEGKVAPHELFEAGVAFLEAKGGLVEALTDGILLRRRLALGRHLAKRYSRDGIEITIERAPLDRDWQSTDDVMSWVADSLTQRMPVLISFDPPVDHYSVVSAMDAKSIHLFDSSGMKFIRKSSCGLSSARYRLPPNTLLRVAVRRTD